MCDIVWILDYKKGSSLGNAGVSGTYIVPSNDLNIEPSALAGKRIWIVLRGNEDRLLKLIKVRHVERIIEGYYFNDYLISTDIIQSFRFTSGFKNAGKFRISETEELKIGLSYLGDRISNLIPNIVLRAIETKLAIPTKTLLSTIEIKILPNNKRQLARLALKAIIARLSLDQVWASGTGYKLNAFSNFSFFLIKNMLKDYEVPEVIEELRSLDPLSILSVKKKATLPKSRSVPVVDTDFNEIDPDKIFTRTFLPLNSSVNNLEESLRKTGHAEKIHQDILKDISLYLISRGITPFETSSIDLMYKSGSMLNVVEIKSANQNNIFAQSAKGAFQIACYINELIKDYENLHPQLILSKTENNETNNHAATALLRLGVKPLFYDASKPWPDRIEGLAI